MRKITVLFAFLFSIAAIGQNQVYKAKVFKNGVEVGEIGIPIIGSTGGAGQTLSLSGNTLSISEGNSVSLAPINFRGLTVPSDNLNDLVAFGVDWMNGNQTNMPPSVSGDGWLLAMPGTASNDNIQYWYSGTDASIYGRVQQSGVWSNWTQIGAGGGSLTTDQAIRNSNIGKPPKTLVKNDDFTLVANDMRMQTSGNADLGRSYIMTVNDGGTTVATIPDVGAVDDIGRIRTVGESDTFEAIPDTGVTLDWKTKTGTENAVRVNGKGHIAYFQKTSPNNYFFYGDVQGITYTPPSTNLYQENSAANGTSNTNSVGSWISHLGGTSSVVTDATAVGGRAIRATKANNTTNFSGIKLDMSSNALINTWSNGQITGGLPLDTTITFTVDLKMSDPSNTPYYYFRFNNVGRGEGFITGLNSTTYTTKTFTFTTPASGAASIGDAFQILPNTTNNQGGHIDIANLVITY